MTKNSPTHFSPAATAAAPAAAAAAAAECGPFFTHLSNANSHFCLLTKTHTHHAVRGNFKFSTIVMTRACKLVATNAIATKTNFSGNYSRLIINK
jgi:hypothetical protein